MQLQIFFLIFVRTWWDKLCGVGSQFGYFANSSKTFLIVKETNINLPAARAIFEDTGNIWVLLLALLILFNHLLMIR